jgi:tetratricopeptide (TPR) repeat protein
MIVCSGFISSLTVMFVHNLSGFSSRILPTAVFIAFLSAGAAFQDKMREKLLYFHSAKYLRAFYIMILIVSVICVYQGIQTYRINDLIKQANEKFKLATACDNEMNYRHRIKQAVKILQKVLQLDPMNSLAHYKMSDACLVKGETELSKKHLKKAISLNSGEAIFYIRLANFYSNIEQNPKETENCYKKAIELDPACEIFRLEYAKLLISENRKNEAIEQLQKALEYSPGFHQVYTNYLKVEAMLKQLKNSQ